MNLPHWGRPCAPYILRAGEGPDPPETPILAAKSAAAVWYSACVGTEKEDRYR